MYLATPRATLRCRFVPKSRTMFNYRIRVSEGKAPLNLKVMYLFGNQKKAVAGTVARVARPGRLGGKRGGCVCVFSQAFFLGKPDGSFTKTKTATAAFLGGSRK